MSEDESFGPCSRRHVVRFKDVWVTPPRPEAKGVPRPRSLRSGNPRETPAVPLRKSDLLLPRRHRPSPGSSPTPR